MEINLRGKRALVTGASSGIGNAIACALADAGAKVAVNFRSHGEEAERVVQSIAEHGGTAIAVQADVADCETVAEMFEQLDAAWGGIDILINNAGVDGRRNFAWEADIQEWKRVIEVNLMGSFYCAQEALKRMVPQRHGVILSTSSVHEEIAWSGYSAYAASKAAVKMLTKTLAQEAAPHGVRVLSVAPGAIKTPINKSVWANAQGKADLLEKIPMKRLGRPEEVAAMVVVLVSDVASYVTGCSVMVDGGMTDYPSFSHGG